MTSTEPGTLVVKSKTIEAIYREHQRGAYRVNRRYQRKLVWTVEEKERLIDSILKRYPLPQFLVAESGGTEEPRFEIIDGMQRMNAIVSFIENEFSYEGSFFDLESLAITKVARDRKVLTQRQPILDREKSVAFATYEIAQSAYRTSSSESIEEVFRRINASGQKLSRQDLRQAGSTSPIADLVREIASLVRGDVSQGNMVPLSKMPALSIASNNNPYGISPDEMFWVKQGILNRSDVRTSHDEQLILDIVADMVFKSIQNTGTPTRNALFGYDDGRQGSVGIEAEDILTDPAWQLGRSDRIKAEFLGTFDRVEKIVAELPSGVRLVRHIGQRGNNPIPRYFEAIFVAIWQLVYGEGRDLSSASLAVDQLDRCPVFKGMPQGGGEWIAKDKIRVISDLKDKLRHAFDVTRIESSDISASNVLSGSDFAGLISGALVETTSFDIKQGFLSLDEARGFDKESLRKILRTLTAISNTHPTIGGSVAIGIADSDADASRIKTLDGVDPLQYRGYRIVGIDRELDVIEATLDQLWDRVIRSVLDSPDLPRGYAREAARNSCIASYNGRRMVILAAPKVSTPVSFGGLYYERIGSNTCEVDDAIAFGMNFQGRLG